MSSLENSVVKGKGDKILGPGETGQRAVVVGKGRSKNIFKPGKTAKKAVKVLPKITKKLISGEEFVSFLIKGQEPARNEPFLPDYQRTQFLESGCSYKPDEFGILVRGNYQCRAVEMTYFLTGKPEERKIIEVKSSAYKKELTAVLFKEQYQTPNDPIEEFRIEFVFES